MRRSQLVFATLVVIVGLSFGDAVRAQSTATLIGQVTDTQQQPLPGVTMTLSATGFPTATGRTGEKGFYRFPALWPFTIYTISAAHPDFRGTEYAGMQLETGEARRVNFRLKRPGEREVVVLTTRDPYPHEDLVDAFVDQLDVPVRIVDLDEERDAAAAVRRIQDFTRRHCARFSQWRFRALAP